MRGRHEAPHRAVGVLAGSTLCLATMIAALVVPSERASADPGGSTRPADEASAMARARATGERVEVFSRRTQTAQVFANPSGTFTAEEHARPVRVQRPDGSWAPVDTTLVRNADGSISPRAAAVDLVLSGGGSQPLARLAWQGRSWSLGWPHPLPIPELAGDTATYPEVLPGVDLTVRADVDGFAKVLVVKDREAARHPALTRLRFTTAMHGVRLRPEPGGVIVAVDDGGTVVFATGTAAMWDSSDRRVTMPVELSVDELVLVPEPRLLIDPDTVFPVFIDPTVSPPGGHWSMINQRFPNDSYWDQDRNDGAKAGFSEDPRVGWVRYRSMFSFALGAYRGKTVIRGNATFGATLTHSYDCAPSNTDLYTIAPYGPTTTWNNHAASWTSNRFLHNAYNQSCNNARIWTEWRGSLPGAVQTVMNSGGTLYLGLRAQDESTHHGWKKFDPASAKLTFEFNSVPNAPSQLTVEGRACATGDGRPYVGATAPQLRAFLSDPDAGQALNYGYSWAALGAPRSENDRVTGANIANGSFAPNRIPTGRLADGATYYWQAIVGDSIQLSPWSAQCEFTVDVTRPGQTPTVTSTDYPDDGNFHGGVGRAGTFTFAASGVGDVAAYLYGFADPPTTEAAANTLGGAVSLRLTPATEGLTTLYVRSKDRAGNLSDIIRYVFRVGSATGPAGHWQADEGTDTTLGDASGHDRPARLSGGTSWTAGRSGGGDRAIRLDGSSGQAMTTGPAIPTDRNFTVAAWVRLTRTGTFFTAVSQDGTRSSSFYLQYRTDVNRWAFSMRAADSDAASTRSALSSGPPLLNVWTHLVGVHEATTGELRLYVNGRLAGSASFATAWNAAGSLVIGRAKHQGNLVDYWPGDLDDVRVWDRVVYPDEIAAIANTRTLVGEWTFDEGAGTTAGDTSGYSHPATLAGGTTWTTGHNGTSAVACNGTTGHTATTTPVVLTDQSFTVSAWVRLTRTGGFFTAVGQDGTVSSSFYLQYRSDVNRWAFAMRQADSSAAATTFAHSATAPALNTWTHLVGVHDAATRQLKLYVAGQLATTIGFTFAWHAIGPLTIGRAKTGGNLVDHWPGDLDDVRVYLGALSDAEIVELSNR